MFNATFTVRPVPSTDKVVVGITPGSFVSLLVKTTLWYVIPFAGLIAVSEIHDRLPKKSKNTEEHLPHNN